MENLKDDLDYVDDDDWFVMDETTTTKKVMIDHDDDQDDGDDGGTGDDDRPITPPPFPEATQIQRRRSTEDALKQFLLNINMESFAPGLAKLGVTCLADCAFVEYDDLVVSTTNKNSNDTTAVGMTVIQARKFLKARDQILLKTNKESTTEIHHNNKPRATTAAVTTTASSSPVAAASGLSVAQQRLQHSGPVMKKGFLPKGQLFTDQQLKRLRNRRYDATSSTWVKRDVPLSDDELDCWQEQAQWLVCPITGLKWIDPTTILGVGIYHAPRDVSNEERQRMYKWEQENAKWKQKQQIRGKHIVDNEDNAWWRNFFVYPNVAPPPKPFAVDPQTTSNNENDPESAQMGRVELIIGPAFDVTAYNMGIHGGSLCMNGVVTTVTSKYRRGVWHNDLQWNAINFEYWICRDGNDNFIKKQCTNRLSFYIEDFHGQRVFPNNIRSQLSLLLWRDRNRLTLPNGTTDQHLLAVAVRKVLPRILLAAINEIIRGTSTAKNNKQCSDQYLQYAMRTFFLIHQVSIKLVLYFPKTREQLLTGILRWIMAPFSNQAQREWPHDGTGLLEVLLGTCLVVGVPWHVLRETFMRALFTQLVRTSPELWKFYHSQKDLGAELPRRLLSAVFQKQYPFLRQILIVFTFVTGMGRTVGELDRCYSRCAGTLPFKEREVFMARVKEATSKLESLETFWVEMGMEANNNNLDRFEIQQHIGAMLKFCAEADASLRSRRRSPAQKLHWRLSDLPANEEIATRTNEQRLLLSERKLQTFSEVVDAIAGYSRTVDASKTLAVERAKHVGYPKLNASGELDRLVCNYEGCGRRFKRRDHLFRHLRQMVGDDRMVQDFHLRHFRLRQVGQLHLAAANGFACPACGEVFATIGDLRDHLRDIGGFTFSDHSSSSSEDTDEAADALEYAKSVMLQRESYYLDLDRCCICWKGLRESMLLPCGHLYACTTCGVRQSKCVVCAQACTDVLGVSHVDCTIM